MQDIKTIVEDLKEETIIEAKHIAELAVRAADAKRAEDIMVLDVQEISLLADYFMICSANSERQINAIVDEIIEKEEEQQVTVKRIEGKDGGKWVLIDLGDVIVHVFQTNERSFYNLEKLWSDAPLVSIHEWLSE